MRKVSVLTLGAYSLSEAQWDLLKARLAPDVRRELQERVDSGVKGQPLTAKIIDDLLFTIPSGRQPLEGAFEAAAGAAEQQFPSAMGEPSRSWRALAAKGV